MVPTVPHARQDVMWLSKQAGMSAFTARACGLPERTLPQVVNWMLDRMERNTFLKFLHSSLLFLAISRTWGLLRWHYVERLSRERKMPTLSRKCSFPEPHVASEAVWLCWPGESAELRDLTWVETAIPLHLMRCIRSAALGSLLGEDIWTENRKTKSHVKVDFYDYKSMLNILKSCGLC